MQIKNAIKSVKFILAIEITLAMIALITCFLNYCILAKIVSEYGIDYSQWLFLLADKHIPMIPIFILPYMFDWIYPFIVVIYLWLHPNVNFGMGRRIAIGAIILLLLHYAMFCILPLNAQILLNSADLSAIKHYPWLEPLLSMTYGLLSLWNSFPSFHVASAWYIYRIIRYYTKSTAYVFLLLTILIILSTMLIKVHFIVDVLGGILFAELVFQLVKYFEIKKIGESISNKKVIIFYAVIGLLCLNFFILGNIFIGWHQINLHELNYKF